MIRILLFLFLIISSNSFAAISETSLDSGSTGAVTTSFTTSTSVSPADNNLVIFCWDAGKVAGNVPTVQFNGSGGHAMTQIATISVAGGSATFESITCYRLMGTSLGSGTFTATVSTNNTAGWSVFEFSGVDTSGSNGSGAIVQSNTNTCAAAATCTATLSSSIGSGNATAAAWITASLTGGTTITGDATYSGIHNISVTSVRMNTEWKQAGKTTSTDTCTGTPNLGGIIFEIKAASSVIPNTTQIY